MIANSLERCIERSLQLLGDTIILITHSGTIFNIEKLFNIRSYESTFQPIPQACFFQLRIPLASQFDAYSGAIGRWRCETPEKYMSKLFEVDREIARIEKKWSEETEVYTNTTNWEILIDTWRQEKNQSRVGDDSLVLLAIARFNCASVRDLKKEHLEALEELDRLFPETRYIKFIQYPPYVWKLHVHIIEKRRDSSSSSIHIMHYNNNILLKDAIQILRQNKDGFAKRNMLIYCPFN
jgi:hypothetical protein